MEKMIRVINNNLRSVINGIKEHRYNLETSLDEIKTNMSAKITEANGYKCDVEHARLIISQLEGEISELESDLNELNEKFGSKDFKEILVAGNKEINAKIIEKRASINEQGQIIIELTDKAHVLKEQLVELKDKKLATEATLEKTRTLEYYFETRITDVITYSEENPGELASYVKEEPQEELVSQEDIDINVVIDESVFEEIDEISAVDSHEDLVNDEDIEEPSESEEVSVEQEIEAVREEATEEESGAVDFVMTDQLEDMISEAKSIIERNSSLMTEVNEELKPEDINEQQEDKIVEEDVEELIIEDDVVESMIDEDNGVQIDSSNEEVSDETDENVIDIFVEDDDTPIDPSLVIAADKKKRPVTLHTMSEPIIPEDAPILFDEVVVEENDSLVDENILSENTFNVSEEIDFHQELRECGIEPDTFGEDDLILLQSGFDKNSTKEFVNILNKYGVSIDNIYKNVRVLLYVTSQNLDKMLSLLIGTGAKTSDIDYVFDKLDIVNVNKLEQNCMSTINAQLAEVLLTAMPYTESDILTRLELSRKDIEVLKKTATAEDFKIFNMFPEIILANYEELKKFNVNNLVECITKHPHRFTFNPANFYAILDKYDTEDLIRCINKNSAVLDRL